ncbi:hypothetical protein [Secundilactobacillus oryzae]|uniref:hypothetical protein n=1 Tax=Secundilactobacillus oryzae TaxID=1202668 RepID=UPI000A4E8431
MNCKIKQTKRTAYDYKNWKTFIYRIRDWNQNRKKRNQFVNKLVSKYNFVNTG